MPHDISYEAQDLIRKILVTDPSKRITVSDAPLPYLRSAATIPTFSLSIIRQSKLNAIHGLLKIFLRR